MRSNTRLFQLAQLLVFLTTCFLISGCATQNKDKYAEWSAEDLYKKAVKLTKRDQPAEAIAVYEALDSHFPFGAYTEQAHLDLIYVYYQENDMPAALNAADRFIQMHPRSANLDYAYYMRGLIKFHENIGFLESKLYLDPTYRQTATDRESFAYFHQLINRFPDSPYSVDARQRMIYLRNHLARSELNSAYWYIRRKAYLAAANRAKFIVEHYEHATSVPDALAVMVYCYRKLSLDLLANDAERVLRINYPDNRSLEQLERYREYHPFGFL